MNVEVTFADLYRAAHGHGPFPWQAELAAQVLQQGRWPDVLDIPTGLGKTSLIDISVWLAATTGCAAGTAGRRRTFFVIDRRVVVDEAYEHAKQLAEALRGDEPACRAVAGALQDLTDDRGPEGERSADPLPVARMRGGVTWGWRWLDRPDRPAVVVGTVDQLGSRFLFRGYGLSGELAPIDAALVGNDSLIVIDEAHLSQPLMTTIRAATGTDGLDRSPISTGRPIVVPMSATLAKDDGSAVHRISAADEADPVARKRLHAPKRLYTVEVGGPARTRDARTTQSLTDLAVVLADDTKVQAVAVLCNTVGRARRVFDALEGEPRVKGLGQAAGAAVEVGLLTGRVRPWDRERLTERYLKLVGSGRRRSEHPPTILVTTQTIEVGANLDFDAMVTESASWDSLSQRFGRLNRLGKHDDKEDPCRVVVVHDGVPSYLYGEARERTWQMLAEREAPISRIRTVADLTNGLDVCPSALRTLAAEIDAPELALTPEAVPTLLASHLDTWVKTSPQPVTDVPVAPFLHGYNSSQPEVRLVWRAGLPTVAGNAQRQVAWSTLVDALPPTSDEVLDLPLATFRRWVRGRDDIEASAIADQVGRAMPEAESGTDVSQDPPTEALRLFALRWRGPEDADLLDLPSQANRIRPEDLLVLSAEVGGCDRFGWAPTSETPVPDLADVAGPAPTLRLSPPSALRNTLKLLAVRGPETPEAKLSALVDEAWELDDLHDLQERVIEIWDREFERGRAYGPGEVRSSVSPRLAWIDRADKNLTKQLLVRFDTSRYRGGRVRYLSDAGASPGASSSTGDQVPLKQHMDAVAERARSIASRLGLNDALTEACVLAAAWHDTGKLDRRFQVMLHGGDDLAANSALAASRPLAKSGMNPADRWAFREAARVAGVPKGFRHEVASTAAMVDHLSTSGVAELDAELVTHLVAAHHGRCRPMFPPVLDGAAPWNLEWEGTSVKVDPGQPMDWASPARFRTLNQRYGRWGLALLETVVRLADIGCSEEGT